MAQLGHREGSHTSPFPSSCWAENRPGREANGGDENIDKGCVHMVSAQPFADVLKVVGERERETDRQRRGGREEERERAKEIIYCRFLFCLC